MKRLLLLACWLVLGCQGERFRKEADAFPDPYVGQWEAVLPGAGPQIFQAGITIEPSGDSLVWGYFAQRVDTVTKQKMACGPEVWRMPIWWDDSLQLAQANHGVGQGFGFDFLRLTRADRLQMNSPSLAPNCRGFFGVNTSQLIFSKVQHFRYKP